MRLRLTTLAALILSWPGQSFLLAEAPDTAEPKITASILKTEEPVTLDGVLDEACWKAAAVTEVKYIMGKKGVAAEKPPMLVRFTWDNHYLYIGYETFDKNLIAIGKLENQGPLDNLRQGCEIWHPDPKVKVDVVEFFITFGDQNFFWELHHNASNQFNDVLTIRTLPDWNKFKSPLNSYDIYFGEKEYVPDEEGYRLALAAKVKPKEDGSPSTINDEKDVDAGYTGELRLPWYGLNAPLTVRAMNEFPPKEGDKRPIYKAGPWQMAGQEIWIMSVFQDGDLQDRYHHSSPTMPGGWFHHNILNYPRYRIEGKNTPPIRLPAK